MIANSLSITIAQRTREFATVRTIGGSRRQILTSILLEALVVGVLASLIGLAVGVGLAKALFWLFDAVGFTLPNSGLILEPTAVVIALAAGILVTLLASIRPAFRATRVPPIAAVREGAAAAAVPLRAIPSPGLDPSHPPRLRRPLLESLRPGIEHDGLLVWMGLGALLIFLGVAFLAERLVRPLAAGSAGPGRESAASRDRWRATTLGATRSGRPRRRLR